MGRRDHRYRDADHRFSGIAIGEIKQNFAKTGEFFELRFGAVSLVD